MDNWVGIMWKIYVVIDTRKCTAAIFSILVWKVCIGCKILDKKIESDFFPAHWNLNQLEQLERLRSEDTPCRPVITLTIDQLILNPKSILLISSYRIPSQKKVKAEKIRKICEKI